MAAHEAGNYVRYSNFTSTAKKEGAFGSGMDIKIIIRGKSGVDVQHLSRYGHESEILMPRHAVYRVIKKAKKGMRTEITLEEVTELPQDSAVIQLSATGGTWKKDITP